MIYPPKKILSVRYDVKMWMIVTFNIVIILWQIFYCCNQALSTIPIQPYFIRPIYNRLLVTKYWLLLWCSHVAHTMCTGCLLAQLISEIINVCSRISLTVCSQHLSKWLIWQRMSNLNIGLSCLLFLMEKMLIQLHLVGEVLRLLFIALVPLTARLISITRYVWSHSLTLQPHYPRI